MLVIPKQRGGLRRTLSRLAGTLGIFAMLSSCSTVTPPVDTNSLRQTADLIEEVKAFGKTIGIEPTDALRRTSQGGPSLSMLWLWMQRDGTLALEGPVDIRLAIGLNVEKETPEIEQVYRVDGYSVYYRQGSEFADPRSVATVGFAEEPLVRRAKVILHEDLHGDVNFALPWEIEEAIVTPLGSLAVVEYLRSKGDEKNLRNALVSLADERTVSRELMAVVDAAQRMFAVEQIDEAKRQILSKLENYPNYQRQFERQTRGQHGATVLEAKLSHDMAYYRYFDAIAALAEKAPDLRTLIEDLKKLPKDTTHTLLEQYLIELNSKYTIAAK
jgi:predicted SprT family Zn-dependent metalloprotease